MTVHPRSASPGQPGTETSLAELRDQLLGPPRESEDPESYRRRAYQAWAQAVELAGTESPASTDGDPSPEGDPATTPAQTGLAAISETLAGADRCWMQDTALPPP
jgi:hypothetical protein